MSGPQPPEVARGAPLAGVRVLALEQFGAGPFNTLFLADLGAEVVKIEDPRTGGDVGRYVPPGQHGTDSLYFEAFNRGKRSIVLDLKNESGRVVFHRLVARADAVVSNLRGDAVADLGLTHEALRAFNPRIVCVSLTGYGRSGSDAARAGYDPLIQAEAGWAALTGAPGDPPTRSGLSLADYVGGLVAALALLAGLHDARRTGVGRDVAVNLYDAALAMLTYLATWYLTGGVLVDRLPQSAHPSIVPFQFFETADGWLAVACAKEKFFTALLRALDLDELRNDERFASFAARRDHREELLAILADRFRQRTTGDWLRLLGGSVPVAPVRSLPEVLEPDALRARGLLAEYSHPVLGDVCSIGLPISFDGWRPHYSPGPGLGADGEAILSELGYRPSEVLDLVAAGAFGPVERPPNVDSGEDARPG